MDGAGALGRFVHITIPQLKTVSLTLIFIHIIWTAINLDFIWVITQGGLLNASETLPIMLYRHALEDFDGGATSAVAMMSMGVMLAAFAALDRGRRMVTARLERAVRSGANYRTLCVFAAFCIFLFLWMADTALKPIDEVRAAHPTFWIIRPTLENSRHVLTDGDCLIYFRNSAIVAGGSITLVTQSTDRRVWPANRAAEV
jgi:ABC-type glycerol-3-phosphate transport system permease component